MRKVFIAGVCALCLSARAVSAQASAPQKFAYINSQTLLAAAPGSAEAQATLEKDMGGFRQQLQKMQDSMTVLQGAYTKDEVGLSPTAKEARLKVLRDRQAEFQDKAAKLNDQSEARQQEVMGPIMDNVKKVLEDFRAENGYSFIFDTANPGVIVAVDKNLDQTERVLARLKLSAPKAASTKAPGPTTKPAGVTKRPPPQ
jgi:outer membrane protein